MILKMVHWFPLFQPLWQFWSWYWVTPNSSIRNLQIQRNEKKIHPDYIPEKWISADKIPSDKTNTSAYNASYVDNLKLFWVGMLDY